MTLIVWSFSKSLYKVLWQCRQHEWKRNCFAVQTLFVFLTVAKDRLSDLTSREGDWFLDELCSMSGNVNQLLLLLKDHPMVREEI